MPAPRPGGARRRRRRGPPRGGRCRRPALDPVVQARDPRLAHRLHDGRGRGRRRGRPPRAPRLGVGGRVLRRPRRRGAHRGQPRRAPASSPTSSSPGRRPPGRRSTPGRRWPSPAPASSWRRERRGDGSRCCAWPGSGLGGPLGWGRQFWPWITLARRGGGPPAPARPPGGHRTGQPLRARARPGRRTSQRPSAGRCTARPSCRRPRRPSGSSSASSPARSSAASASSATSSVAAATVHPRRPRRRRPLARGLSRPHPSRRAVTRQPSRPRTRSTSTGASGRPGLRHLLDRPRRRGSGATPSRARSTARVPRP